jgi:hypothetical protein
MMFAEWVELVLGRLYSWTLLDHDPIGVEELGPPPTSMPAPAERAAILLALGELEAMELVTPVDGLFRLTPKGHALGRDSFATDRALLTELALWDEDRELVRAANALSEIRREGHTSVRWVSLEEIASYLDLGAGRPVERLAASLRDLGWVGVLAVVECAEAGLLVRGTYISSVIARLAEAAQGATMLERVLERPESSLTAFIDDGGATDPDTGADRVLAALANTSVRGRRYLVVGIDRVGRPPDRQPTLVAEGPPETVEPAVERRVFRLAAAGSPAAIVEVLRRPAALPHRPLGRGRPSEVPVLVDGVIRHAGPEAIAELEGEAAIGRSVEQGCPKGP